MMFIQWHVGDWISSTAIMSATERGVYFDLLIRYYSEERPLMQEECTRIARAYDEHEREAMQYVLKKHFTLEDGVYRHNRCEKEIAEFRVRSEKRSRAAKIRWSKGDNGSSGLSEDRGIASEHANGYARASAREDAYAGASAEHLECQPLTVNRKPIKEKNTREEPSPASPAETEEPSDGKAKKRPTPTRGEYARSSYVGLDGVSDELWADWIKLRKRKRTTVTQRVIDGIAKEAGKAGLSLADAMETQIERGWSSFKAEWVSRSGGSRLPANRSKPLSEMNYDSYDALYGPGV